MQKETYRRIGGSESLITLHSSYAPFCCTLQDIGRAEKTFQHYRTLQALPHILGRDRQADAEYLDACRIKRNTVEYDYAGGATKKDAAELIEFALELRENVMKWLHQQYIELLLPNDK
jgi:hypothetical protein